MKKEKNNHLFLFLENLKTHSKSLSRENAGNSLIFVLIALVMLAMIKYGFQNSFFLYFKNHSYFKDINHNTLRFISQVYLSINSIVLFVIIPLVFHFIFPVSGENTLGLRIRGIKSHLPKYLIILLFILPIVWLSCKSRAFHNFYPMYKPVSLKMWILYEMVYMVHFFTVEFFFRGFIIFRLEKTFDKYAVWIMLIPYVLLHLQKPLPEAAASVFAGIVLGHLALLCRSIWPGVFVHCCVAFSADLFSLIESGRMKILLG